MRFRTGRFRLHKNVYFLQLQGYEETWLKLLKPRNRNERRVRLS